MRVIITCGPSSEPIDEVRYLTNFSTGELGALLCQKFYATGHDVTLLRSVHSIHPIDTSIATVIPFTKNDDLEKELQKLSKEEHYDALFHAAALCDYRMQTITTSAGEAVSYGKIPTGLGSLNISLEPTRKIIAELRAWFPESLLVGWKYEIDGAADEAIFKARLQISKYHLDASIANGKLFGKGFEFIPAEGPTVSLHSKEQLAGFLLTLLERRVLGATRINF